MFPITFSANAALSATTAKTIQGTNPYIELNGVKAVDLSSLLSIKIGSDTYISNASGVMQKDNGDGTYTAVSLITLPNAGDTFDSVKTLVPANTTSYALNNPTIIPLTARKDDDGDGTFTVSGNLKGEWKDKNGTSVGSTLTGLPNPCLAPYTLTLTTSGNPTITTQYGNPRTTTYGNNQAKFTIKPVEQPRICHATPGSMTQYAGPASMWDTTKGFKLQSSSDYSKNFPTTGSDKLYFDLDIGGSPSVLTWSPVTVNGITATMSNITATKVRVTLMGPAASASQKASATPGAVSKPSLPSQIVLQGKDSGGTVIVDYGFVIQQWFINRGTSSSTAVSASAQTTWCTSTGYTIARVKDLTNASGTAGLNGGTIPGATPASSGNYYQRRIGGGLFSEWGNMGSYTGSDWSSLGNWTGDTTGASFFAVDSGNGYVVSKSVNNGFFGACRSQ